MMRSIRDADIAGRRVLVRVDFNVPLKNGTITDDTRIRAALPTIDYLLERDACVILCSHLGRPNGKPTEDLELRPVAARVAELLGRPVATVSDVVGPEARAASAAMTHGDVLLLENVRFEPGEETNDPGLAKKLASLADLYVNDAFGTAHRAHASTVGVAEHLAAYAGFLMIDEVESLQRLMNDPGRPFITILGGAKVSDKIGVIQNLMSKVDGFLIGGGMANTFLLAQGLPIGTSLAEPDLADKARDLIELATRSGVELHLPSDVVVASSLDGDPLVVRADSVRDGQAIFDIGPATAKAFTARIDGAETVFWNGPMGVFEKPAFARGTREIASAVAASGSFSVVGGGDSVAAVEQMGMADRISHISTGGGASLEYVEGRQLPGIAALQGHP